MIANRGPWGPWGPVAFVTASSCHSLRTSPLLRLLRSLHTCSHSVNQHTCKPSTTISCSSSLIPLPPCSLPHEAFRHSPAPSFQDSSFHLGPAWFVCFQGQLCRPESSLSLHDHEFCLHSVGLTDGWGAKHAFMSVSKLSEKSPITPGEVVRCAVSLFGQKKSPWRVGKSLNLQERSQVANSGIL